MVFLFLFSKFYSSLLKNKKKIILQGSCPSKHKGRPDIKGLSNYCEWFATYTLLGKFYNDKLVYQQIFGDSTEETEWEKIDNRL